MNIKCKRYTKIIYIRLTNYADHAWVRYCALAGRNLCAHVCHERVRRNVIPLAWNPELGGNLIKRWSRKWINLEWKKPKDYLYKQNGFSKIMKQKTRLRRVLSKKSIVNIIQNCDFSSDSLFGSIKKNDNVTAVEVILRNLKNDTKERSVTVR